MSKLKVFSAIGLICAYVLVGHQALADEPKKTVQKPTTWQPSSGGVFYLRNTHDSGAAGSWQPSSGTFFLKNTNGPVDAGAGTWPTADGLKTSAEVIESTKGVRYITPRAYQVSSPGPQPAARRVHSKPVTFTQSTTTPARKFNGITSPQIAGKRQTNPQAAYNPKELSASKSVPWIRVAQPRSN